MQWQPQRAHRKKKMRVSTPDHLQQNGKKGKENSSATLVLRKKKAHCSGEGGGKPAS